MLRIPFIIMMLVPPTFATDYAYIDSKTNPNLRWVLIDDCKVPIMKDKMSDICYVVKKVNNTCHLHLTFEDCHAN